MRPNFQQALTQRNRSAIPSANVERYYQRDLHRRLQRDAAHLEWTDEMLLEMVEGSFPYSVDKMLKQRNKAVQQMLESMERLDVHIYPEKDCRGYLDNSR